MNTIVGNLAIDYFDLCRDCEALEDQINSMKMFQNDWNADQVSLMKEQLELLNELKDIISVRIQDARKKAIQAQYNTRKEED